MTDTAANDRALAHLLLTELLAYQFASPVQWIETQRVLFEDSNTERLIEFGPSTTLVNMAKRTIQEFSTRRPDILDPKLLSIKSDEDELYYATVPTAPEKQVIQKPTKALATVEETFASQILPSSPPTRIDPVPSAPSPRPSAAIEDIKLSALQSLSCLIAIGLKKKASEVDLHESIRTLSKGRSTVQNEIMGDLLNEFGSLPDDGENMPISELAASLEKNYHSPLQKALRTRIEKMMSTKMASSFLTPAARLHLQEDWGLPTGRQTAVLLRALLEQPEERLPGLSESKAYFDHLAKAYLEEHNLSRPTPSHGANAQAGAVMLDPSVLRQLHEDQKTLRESIAALLMAGSEGVQDKLSSHFDLGDAVQAKLDAQLAELGEDFCRGIEPIFNASQGRTYDSGWNWVHLNLLSLYRKSLSTEISEHPTLDDVLLLYERVGGTWSSRLDQVVDWLLDTKKDTTQPLSSRAEQTVRLIHNIRTASSSQQLHASYARARPISSGLVTPPDEITGLSATHEKVLALSVVSDSGIDTPATPSSEICESPVQFFRKDGPSWVPHQNMNNLESWSFDLPPKAFQDKNILLTGAGPGSIGMAMLPELLKRGATVVVTTSRAMAQAGPVFQEVYSKYASEHARLLLFPGNQGSQQDVSRLIEHIYDSKKGPGLDLDFIIPFAAVSETGREIDNLDSRSELAHRLMLVNVLRILGHVKAAKERLGSYTRPAHVLLPLSPNIGTFGGDGLYSESKLGLYAVMNKWATEHWSQYLSLCGVVIGWTRGTGLMAGNDGLASEVAKLGIETFSTKDMTDHLVRLMSTQVVSRCQDEALLADVSGGLLDQKDLARVMSDFRQAAREREDITRSLAAEKALDDAAMIKPSPPGPRSPTSLNPVTVLNLPFPQLLKYDEVLGPLHAKLAGMADLESVVVVVGFAELGPWGNSRTRWEMELNGQLSIQGCIELAWMTGLIKYDSSNDGWIDVATKTPVKDVDVKSRYEKQLLENTGLRLIESRPLDHAAMDKQQVLQEVVLDRDLAPFSTSRETALDFASQHGSSVEITPMADGDEFSVKFKKGTTLLIPKATAYDFFVGGQLPAGWDPKVYGLPDDICDNVDRITLIALVTAAEAFLSAGITDLYELYKSIHIADLANCVGSGMGGAQSLQKMYVERLMDKPVQGDILAETFINTTSAWLNMLLLSSAGANRTPVGACATALESLNQGYDLIVSGAAKVCLVGGSDDMTKPTSAEFGRMKATNNCAADLARGRAPHEMSRPCASSRCGFVESEGSGMQVITNAKIALELGLPIRAVVAHVQTASDGVGRSVPAPGQGIMTGARADQSGRVPSALLDMKFRRRLLDRSLANIHESYSISPWDEPGREEDRRLGIEREEREVRKRFGNEFWRHDPRISPIAGSLAVWGLTSNDVGVVSMHGTSTEKNEVNEAQVLNHQFKSLARKSGNAAMAVCQKYLTGHPKAAAAAWMLNGACQIMDCATVPGNRNLDNVDASLEPFEHLVFPNQSMKLPEVNAIGLTSFGFGQKGAQAFLVHPKFLLAMLSEEQYSQYVRHRDDRHRLTQQHFEDAFTEGHMVTIKDEGPYAAENRVQALLDSSWRSGVGGSS